MMLNKVFCLILILSSIQLNAQLFENGSILLPTNGASGQSMDLKAFDIDADGDLDIILANEFQSNTLLINNLSQGFSKSTQPNMEAVVNDSEDVVVYDFNQDGFPDLFFCSEDDVTLGETNVHEFYLGSSNGTFERSNFQFPDTEANAVILVDINQDELPDILLGNNGPIVCLISNGDGTFNNESIRFPAINKTTQDLLAADVNMDGHIDIVEGNENGNVLYLNLGDGNFEERTSSLPMQNIETRKISAGDYDGDGYPDLFLSNVEFINGKDRQNRLWKNDGQGNFSDVTASALPIDNDHTIDGIFADLDNDNDLDLILGNIFGTPNRIYLNTDGAFEDKTFEVLGELFTINTLGVIFEDLNNDGKNDIYFCDRNVGMGTKDLLLLNSQTTGIIEQSTIDISVYPNPANNSISITSEVPISRAQILTMAGDSILDHPSNNQTNFILDIKDIANGSYVIMLLKDDSILYKKIFFIKGK